MAKAFITTVPFGEKSRLPLDLLDKANIEYLINPLNKKLTENELCDLISDFDYLIAGTEIISDRVMSSAKNLKFISRVGIGLDGVDLSSAKKRGIKVSYTPDAPAPAVAEFTIGLMLTLLRSHHVSNTQLHNKKWHRIFGRRLEEVTIGIIGAGRIGSRLVKLLTGFGARRILINDLVPNQKLSEEFSAIEWVSNKEDIYKHADVVSLHVPLTPQTINMIREKELNTMKRDAILINTSRGGIINEEDLYNVLKGGHLSAAAIDVFKQEPYMGNLSEIDRCYLTAHMGSMSIDCRTKMEIEATEEAVRFHLKKSLQNPVPEAEYELQSNGA